MNIRFYLDASFKTLKECSSAERYDGGRKWTEYYLNGDVRVYQEGDRYYVSISDMEEPISELIRNLTIGVSIHDSFSLEPVRTIGVYAKSGAGGTLDRKAHGYELKIRGSRAEDVYMLYHSIRQGVIRPSESWDGRQLR